ncbi:MAG TPA: hypothetical protein VF753_16530 [Terriglobales bacterium]
MPYPSPKIIIPDGFSREESLVFETDHTAPDLVPGLSLTPPGGRTISQRINPAAFAMPAPGTFGDAPRDVARGPGAWQIDVALGKHIPLTERLQMGFRAECFNIFNHPQYGLPQATFGVAGFGSIIQTVNTTTPVSPVGSGTPREMQFAPALQFLIAGEKPNTTTATASCDSSPPTPLIRDNF